MALDWSKDISFSGLAKSKSRAKSEYPSKRYMNLVVEDRKQLEMRKAVPVGILLLLLVVAFSKFGVYDFYDRVNHAAAELSKQRTVLAEYEAQLVNYDEVLAEYEAYESSRLSVDEETVSAIDALELVDGYIAPVARVASIDLRGNTMSLSLADISLDGVGALANTLNAQPMVADVSVSTASTSQGQTSEVLVSMVVTLQKAGEGQ